MTEKFAPEAVIAYLKELLSTTIPDEQGLCVPPVFPFTTSVIGTMVRAMKIENNTLSILDMYRICAEKLINSFLFLWFFITSLLRNPHPNPVRAALKDVLNGSDMPRQTFVLGSVKDSTTPYLWQTWSNEDLPRDQEPTIVLNQAIVPQVLTWFLRFFFSLCVKKKDIAVSIFCVLDRLSMMLSIVAAKTRHKATASCNTSRRITISRNTILAYNYETCAGMWNE
jgi:hypothetical protein